jgi:hypothetical protein
VDAVYEAQPAAYERTGKHEADNAGAQSYKKLKHIEFPE